VETLTKKGTGRAKEKKGKERKKKKSEARLTSGVAKGG